MTVSCILFLFLKKIEFSLVVVGKAHMRTFVAGNNQQIINDATLG